MRIRDGEVLAAPLPAAGKTQKPHHHHNTGWKRFQQARASGRRSELEADVYGGPEGDDAPVFSGVGRVVEMKSDVGMAARDLQLGMPRPETGLALAMWFEKLARDLSHSNGHRFTALVQQATGPALTSAVVRASLKLDDHQPMRVLDLESYVSLRVATAPELARDWKTLIGAMRDHLQGLMLAEAGLQPQSRTIIVGLGPDSTLVGLRTRAPRLPAR